ncbi:COG4420 Predicted membrane protein [Candidatus Nanopelagicaceae bacterium]
MMARNNGLDTPRETRRSLRGNYDPEAFGRLSERFARFLGTARFLVYMTVFVIGWITWNTLAPESLRWDKYPFIFLTLILSLQASYAAPLILLAQNRQADRDRIALNEDRARGDRNIADTEYLTRELASLRIALGDVSTRDYVRSELQDVAKEIIEELRKPESDAK